jgi:hypothetical protein
MSNLDSILATVKNEVTAYAAGQFKDLKNEAVADGLAFVKSFETDLQTWTKQLACGKLTQDEFKFLVGSKRDLAELAALKAAGLAQARKDGFVNGLAAVVVNAVVKAV